MRDCLQIIKGIGGAFFKRPTPFLNPAQIISLHASIKNKFDTSMNKFYNKIKRTLKTSGKYHDGLSLLIESTATSLYTISLCKAEMAALDCTTINVATRYGSKLEPHPVFRTLRDAQNLLLKNCKLLGLTYEDTEALINEEDSPLKKIQELMEEE